MTRKMPEGNAAMLQCRGKHCHEVSDCSQGSVEILSSLAAEADTNEIGLPCFRGRNAVNRRPLGRRIGVLDAVF